jgi:ABC-2 type transport system ATP-binding protein
LLVQSLKTEEHSHEYNEQNAISIRNLTKEFGSFRALNDLSLEVKRGEVFGLLGPNGAGKTTTMRILSCLIKPSSGSVYVEGINAIDERNTVEIRRRIGLLTENPNIYERLSAVQNLRFFALAYGLTEAMAEERIAEVLQAFDLNERKNDKVGAFSKGMKQKLAIARALIHKPSVLLLDEPTSALDAESARSIRELILETARRYGHTILISTHNMDDASRLCDRIAILNHGRIIASGREDEIAMEIQRKRKSLGDRVDPIILKISMFETGAFSVQRLITSVKGVTDARQSRDGPRYLFEFMIEPRMTELEVDLLTAKIISSIVALGGEITSAQVVGPSLEDSYMKIIELSKRETKN